MLDWLRRTPDATEVTVAGRTLPLVIRRLPQARRLTLRLAPDGSEVRVSMPRWGRTADALAFAQSRTEWLARQLDSLPTAVALGPGATLTYRGANLIVDHCAAARRTPVIEGSSIRIGGPAESLNSRIQRWLERQALALLEAELAEYCARAARQPPRLALSRARRRWGSCSADGAIRINWRLIMAPDFVRRSVVAHEVAHLVHFDHSAQFHRLLADLFEGSIAEANSWLRREGRSLYLPFG